MYKLINPGKRFRIISTKNGYLLENEFIWSGHLLTKNLMSEWLTLNKIFKFAFPNNNCGIITVFCYCSN